MTWSGKINRIVVLNLTKRDDRLLEFAKMADEYEIPFERVTAVEKPNGAEGLRDTMINLFKDSIDSGIENTLVFEDDAMPVVEPFWFNEYLNKSVEQLPENYHLLFLGCQLNGNSCRHYSANLIKVQKAFSTHAVLWSQQGMRECLSRDMGYPIDNWLVDHIEPLGHSYCTYPLLASQRPGFSDIGKNFIDWRPFIDARFVQQYGNIKR